MSINSVVNDLVTSVSVINALKPLPPTISGYSVAGKDDLALDPAGGQTVQINGTGFLPGATITFDGSAVAVVTYVNPNQLTFTSPAKTAGTYTIYAVNPDGGTAIYVPGIIYSTLPTWTTAAGSLGSYYETTSISNTVVAAGDAPVTYSLFSGSLPTGSTLYANGVITGTAPVDSSSTTYSFTIQASDAQLQDSTRSFSLTINVDAVTWVSPANATTYTSAVDSAIANVTLSATDAAGYAVSYSANALPTGLTLTGSNIAGTPTVIADSSTLLTATAATTNRTATRTINWSITVANDAYFEYNTLLIPGASTTFVDDASTNNFAVTINGDTKPNNFNPYTPGYYSNYFDGTGDYLTTASSPTSAGNFTMEAWIYRTAATLGVVIAYGSEATGRTFMYVTSGGGLVVGIYNVGDTTLGGSIPLNQWTHIAIVRSTNVITGYINGTAQATTASDATTLGNVNGFGVGAGKNGSNTFTGFISNARVVNGVAVYTSNFTPSTTPLTAIANTSLLTCQSNRFIDNSTNNYTMTVFGNTLISSFDPFVPNSSYSTYGSGYFDGTGDYLLVPYNTNINITTGNFTIEAWCYPTTTTNGVDSLWGYGVYGTMVYHAGTTWYWEVGDGGGNYFTITGTAPLNSWNHIACTRSGSTFTLWINGVSAGTNTTAGALASSRALNIGENITGGTQLFTGYINDFRLVKGTAVYTTTFTPPATPLTAIANTSLLVLQNNQSVNNSVFLDNSTNNFLVTRAGNTTQGTFTPYGGNWSNYFDGTGDYLTVPNNTSLGMGSGNFTVEFWVYQTSLVSYRQILDVVDGNSAGRLILWVDSAGTLYNLGQNGNARNTTAAGAITTNTWIHVALVRASGTTKFYINGTQSGSNYTDSTNYTCTTGSVYIGINSDGGTYPYLGYLSNFRMVKGTAVYTSTFTPSTTPLTPITNTSLLTCQSNRIVDTSINNFTVTKNGDVSVQRFSPFNPSSVTATSYSGYFDGSGDYLTIPSNTAFNVFGGDMTIECWFYANSLANSPHIFAFVQDSTNRESIYFASSALTFWSSNSSGNGARIATSALSLNTWYHMALVKSGSTFTLYLNGTSVGTSTTTQYSTSDQSLQIGTYNSGSYAGDNFNGYISNVRVVKGTAVYTSNFTPSTSPLTAIANTSLLTLQSPTFIDNSTNNFTITAFGNSQPIIQNPFGFTSATTNGYTVSTIGGSGYFDGTGDYLEFANNAILLFGSNNFTIEAWVYPTRTGEATIINKLWQGSPVYASYVLYIETANTFRFLASTSGGSWEIDTGSSTTVITPNNWYHVCVVRNGSTFSLYVNGKLEKTTTNAGTLYAHTGPLRIGAAGPATSNSPYFQGYMSDPRMVNGTALYTSSFVPPSAPLTAVQNTSLLTNMTSAGVYDAAMMNNMETVGDAKLSTAVSKFGGSSMSFDGSGDYLVPSAPNSNLNLVLGTGNFTIEFWVYFNSGLGSDIVLYDSRPLTTNGVYPTLYVNSSSQLSYVVSGTDQITSGSAFSATTWYHVALCRSSTSTKMFINGTQVGSTYTDSNNYLNPARRPVIAINGYNETAAPLNGYIDDLRITRGYARYTTNFTPPTTAFPIY